MWADITHYGLDRPGIHLTSVSRDHQGYRLNDIEYEGSDQHILVDSEKRNLAYPRILWHPWIRTTLLHGLAEVRTDWHSIGRRTKEEAGPRGPSLLTAFTTRSYLEPKPVYRRSKTIDRRRSSRITRRFITCKSVDQCDHVHSAAPRPRLCLTCHHKPKRKSVANEM